MKKTIPWAITWFMALMLVFSLNTRGQETINIVQNGDFENWTDGLPDNWVGAITNLPVNGIVEYKTSTYTGASACQLIRTSGTHARFTTDPLSIIADTEYTVTYYARGKGEIRNAFHRDGAYSGYSAYTVLDTDDWTEIVYTFEYSTAVNDVEVIFSVRNTDEVRDHLQIDNVSITYEEVAGVVATPTFSPSGGTFFDDVDVTIATTTDNATIYYSTEANDGPWAEYTEPVAVTETTTLYAYATAADLDDSNVATATFDFPTVVDVADVAALRAGSTDGTFYRLTAEAILTYQQSFRNQKFIQDATAGIMIDDNGGVITTAYDLYDGITSITGTISVFGNMVQFVPAVDPGAATSKANEVEPVVISMQEFNDNFMDYQSRLVTVENISFDVADGTDFANGQVYALTDGLLTAEFRTTFFGVDYIGQPVPSGNGNITGLPNSRSDGNYMTARNLADFEEYEEPLPATVVDIITGSEVHTTLADAVIAADLVDALSAEGPFTVFAPTNAAFDLLPDGLLDGLTVEELTDILLYHVVGALAMSTDLVDGQVIPTLLLGQDVVVTIVDGDVFINNAQVTVADLEAENGVVHVIDAVLVPEVDPETFVTWHFENPSEDIRDTRTTGFWYPERAFFHVVDTLSYSGRNSIAVSYDPATPPDDSQVNNFRMSFDNVHNIGIKPQQTLHARVFVPEDAAEKISQVILYDMWNRAETGGTGFHYVPTIYNVPDDITPGEWATITHLIDRDPTKETLSRIGVRMTIDTEYTGDPPIVFVDFITTDPNAEPLPIPIPTVVDIIVASEDHETLATAVAAADLVETLKGDGPFTVFAPTDDAFAALGTELIDQLLADPEGELTNILLYHVVAGKTFSTDLEDGMKIETLQGQMLTVTIDGDDVFINGAKVIVADLEADNGVVHVIDAVLEPGPATVVDIIVASEVHETLATAVAAADLVETLKGDGPFTVFAPTDDAFAALGTELIEELLADPDGELTRILLYHVAEGKVFSTDLEDEMKIETLQGQMLTVTINDDGVFINDAKVTVVDLQADNGVVHVIDAVLVPGPATVVDIIVASDDHTTLAIAVAAADLVDALSGDGPFTVFAPTDDAFAALGTELINELLTDPEGELANILLYHVVAGKTFSTDLEDGMKIETMQGQMLNVKINDDGVFINDAKVTVVDLQADNGVVHVIDAVLVPLPATVVDIIAASPNHTLLAGAVATAGLVETLQGEGPFTVFAPTDAAFELLPDGLLDGLTIEELTDILLYHVVGALAMSTDLTDGQVITTLLGQDVVVTISADGIFINDAEVILADLEADNGVVHVIDAVLVPVFPLDVATLAELRALPADGTPYHYTGEAVIVAMDGFRNRKFLQDETAAIMIDDQPGVITTEYDLYDEITNVVGEIVVFRQLVQFQPQENTDPATQNTPVDPYDFTIPDITSDDQAKLVKLHNVTFTGITDGQVFENGTNYTITDGTNEMVLRTDFWNVDYIGEEIPDTPLNITGVISQRDDVFQLFSRFAADFEEYVEPLPATVVDIIVGSPDHTLLAGAVAAAGLVETLQGEGPFTVFAPTDDAINALPAGLLEGLSVEELTDILLYHVVGALAMSTDLTDGQVITTLLGQDVVVTISADGVFINDAQVTLADLEADNGVVHVIDAVLIPAEKFSVTFNVDMSTAEDFDPDNDVVYITGSLLGWAEPGTQPDDQTMTRVDDSMIWTKTLVLEAGTYEYKYFINAGWDGGEWAGGDDRIVEVTEDMVVNDIWGDDGTFVDELDPLFVNVFPNPARDNFNITAESVIRSIVVADITGKVVYNDIINDTQTRIHNAFESGIYIVHIYTDEGVFVRKLQIQK